MLKIEQNEIFQKTAIDLLVGGTPCQSFSFAGLREGLAAATGNLALEFCRILAIKRPRWFVWENVPGVHSSFSYEEGSDTVDRKKRPNGREFTETADFATLLTAFRECGYCCAWRVLDAKFFGVPQRRRRVFVVGYLGDDWRPPAAVLFEPKSLRGNPPPSKEPGQGITGTIGRRTGGRSIGAKEAAGGMLIVNALTKKGVGVVGADDNQAHAMHLIPCWWDGGQISQTLDAVLKKGQTMPEKNRFPAVLVPRYFEQRVGRNGRGNMDEVAAPLKAQSGETGKGDAAPCVVYSIMPSGENYKAREVDITQPIKTQSGVSSDRGGDVVLAYNIVVRRLTPLECERLQGFPDYYTNIPGAKDSPRYESIGNSMATVVMRWLGQQIDFYDKVFK